MIHTEVKSVEEKFKDKNFRKVKAAETADKFIHTHQQDAPLKSSQSVSNYFRKKIETKQFTEDQSKENKEVQNEIMPT